MNTEILKDFPLANFEYTVFPLKDKFPSLFLKRLEEITGQKARVRESSLSPKFKVTDYSFSQLVLSHIVDKYEGRQYIVRIDQGGLSSSLDYILLAIVVDITEFYSEPDLVYSDDKYLVIKKGSKPDKEFKISTLYTRLWGSWYSLPALECFDSRHSYVFKIPIEFLRELFMRPIKEKYNKADKWALWFFASSEVDE